MEEESQKPRKRSLENKTSNNDKLSKKLKATDENNEEFTSGFLDLGINLEICKHIKKHLDVHEPTDVQLKSIPSILTGRDVLIKSKTGSGKTLAFVLPMFQLLFSKNEKIKRSDGIFALVFSPTRELATQLSTVINLVLLRSVNIVSGLISGGEKRKSEKARLRKGVNVLISTPARFIDHYKNTFALKDSIRKGNLEFLILDEADRLCDKGFGVQITEIFENITELSIDSVSKCQKIFLSATLNDTINLLIQSYLKKPIYVDLSNEETKYRFPKGLVQQYFLINTGDRLICLYSYLLKTFYKLKANPDELNSASFGILVFLGCRAEVEYFFQLFSMFHWPPKGVLDVFKSSLPAFKDFLEVYKLHGSIDQKERKKTIKQYSRKPDGKIKLRLLFCTDVAARGLDIENIRIVINFRAASEVADYVHRCGRTARNKKKGVSIQFLNKNEDGFVNHVQSFGIKLKELNFDNLVKFVTGASYLKGIKSREDFHNIVQFEDRFRKVKKKKTYVEQAFYDTSIAQKLLQIKIEDLIEDDKQLKKLAVDAYIGCIRSYATYEKKLKPIFHPKKLHLGHLAKSFGLRETPKEISNKNMKYLVKK